MTAQWIVLPFQPVNISAQIILECGWHSRLVSSQAANSNSSKASTSFPLDFLPSLLTEFTTRFVFFLTDGLQNT